MKREHKIIDKILQGKNIKNEITINALIYLKKIFPDYNIELHYLPKENTYEVYFKKNKQLISILRFTDKTINIIKNKGVNL